MIEEIAIRDLGVIGRATQGVRLIGMDDGDAVVSVAKLAEKEDDEPEEAPALEPPTQ